MDLGQIIFLALLQGLTEFLPISSSAHLILPAQIFDWADQGLAFDVAVHVGTLAAVILYFRKDLYLMTLAWLSSLSGGEPSQDSRLAWYIVIATIPAGLAGLIFNDMVENHLRTTTVIAATTIIFAIVLFISDRLGGHHRMIKNLNLKDALIIGAAQVLALIPGVSRSGITITAGLALGLTRECAARFSFLLSIPIILSAGAFKLVELLKIESQVDWQALIIGTVIAFVSAYLCIKWFLKVLDKIGLLPFVIYRLILGAVLWLFFI